MPRSASLAGPPDRLLAAAAAGCGVVALGLSFAGPDAAGGVRVLLLAVAGLLVVGYVRQLQAAERRAAAGWRAALSHQAEQDQQLAALDGDGSGVWGGPPSGAGVLVGGRPEQVAADPAGDRVHPADRRRVRKAWARATAGNSPARVVCRLRGDDGRYRWHVARAEPAAGGGWVGGAVAIDAEARAARRRRAGFRLAADAVAGIVYDLNPQTGRVTRHRGLSEVLGYRDDEVPPTAAGWHALVHPDDRPRVLAAGLTVSPADVRAEQRYRVRHRDGTWRHVLDRAVLFWAGDRLTRVVGCAVDVTAEAAAGDELRAADRRKDDLLGQIAHELRGPLAPIRTAVEAIRAVPGVPPVAARSADIVARQARQLGRLVDDLLDVTRISRGKVRLQPVRCDLREVVGDAVEVVRPLVDARRHTLAVTLPDGPLELDADPGRLVQVVANLLTNAAKYTPDGGAVSVAAVAEGGRAVVRVCDTGLGLPADQLARVFDPFTQLAAGHSRSAGGLGIGLALVRSLVELHGGTAEAASPGPGQGSTFTVRLPLAAAGPAPPAAALSVLVVDDNADAADSLAGLLKLLGHRPRVARDGPAGLAAVREHKPDLVLLDLTLPGLTGEEVAAAVRADPALAGVRLAAVSGRDAVAGGFDARLSKPVGLAELERLLAGGPAAAAEGERGA